MYTYWGNSSSKCNSIIFVSVVPAFGVKSNPVSSDMSSQCLSVNAGLHIIPISGKCCYIKYIVNLIYIVFLCYNVLCTKSKDYNYYEHIIYKPWNLSCFLLFGVLSLKGLANGSCQQNQ